MDASFKAGHLLAEIAPIKSTIAKIEALLSDFEVLLLTLCLTHKNANNARYVTSPSYGVVIRG